MNRSTWLALPALALAVALAPAAVSGQTSRSIGAGITVPTGTFGDLYDNGYTVRGQVGQDLMLFMTHIQAGWSLFPGKDVDDLNVYHLGVGARARMGVLLFGLNAAYFFGDLDEGLGFFPEVGAGVGPIEFVADYRIDGDLNWFGIRAGLKF